MIRTDKPRINGLSHISNYFGKHQGKMGPLLIYLGVASLPIFVWIMFLMLSVSIVYLALFEVLWAGRWGLYILGNEKKKFRAYLNALDSNYISLYDKMSISAIDDDGLIEYTGGSVAKIIQAYPKYFQNEEDYNIAMEEVLDKLRGFDIGIHLHNVVNEHDLLQNVNFSIYKVKSYIVERMNLLRLQEKYSTNNSKLYRLNIIVYGYSAEWKILSDTVDTVVNLGRATVFQTAKVLDSSKSVSDTMARDICAHMSLDTILRSKYSVEDYSGFSVVSYGETEVEEKSVEDKSLDILRERRVTLDTER